MKNINFKVQVIYKKLIKESQRHIGNYQEDYYTAPVAKTIDA